MANLASQHIRFTSIGLPRVATVDIGMGKRDNRDPISIPGLGKFLPIDVIVGADPLLSAATAYFGVGWCGASSAFRAVVGCLDRHENRSWSRTPPVAAREKRTRGCSE